jgi:RNA polymerase sigma-70 factor (ECF subfamily)
METEMQARAEAMAADPIADLIRAGSHREAAGACARGHGAAVGRLCLARLGDQPEAEETVQETLIAAHGAMAQFRGDGSVRAWLFGIARRKCARKLEMRVRRQRRLRLVHDAEAGVELPDELLETQRRATRVRDVLEQLKPSERDAVVLRYQSGLGYREIAEACGIDEAAARKRVSRALARMRSLLGGEDGR